MEMKILILDQFMHKKNRDGIFLMCASIGAAVTFSSDPSFFAEPYDLVLITQGLIPCSFFPQAKKILYGPQNFVFPTREWQQNPGFFDKRCAYTCLSQWVKETWIEFGSLPLPILPLPFAVDVDRFQPDPTQEKNMDCFVYFKHRNQSLLAPILAELQRQNIKPILFRYGTYQEEDYLRVLKQSKFGIWLGSHESQGFAVEEALSCNVPLLVLNVTSMFDEYDDNNNLCYSNEVGRYKLRATSVPYWDDRCGIVSNLENFHKDLAKMMKEFQEFRPREYILETLSPKVCIKRFLEFGEE
jgi:hypothetical protein